MPALPPPCDTGLSHSTFLSYVHRLLKNVLRNSFSHWRLSVCVHTLCTVWMVYMLSCIKTHIKSHPPYLSLQRSHSGFVCALVECGFTISCTHKSPLYSTRSPASMPHEHIYRLLTEETSRPRPIALMMFLTVNSARGWSFSLTTLPRVRRHRQMLV